MRRSHAAGQLAARSSAGSARAGPGRNGLVEHDTGRCAQRRTQNKIVTVARASACVPSIVLARANERRLKPAPQGFPKGELKMSLVDFVPTPKFEEYKERFKQHYKMERRADGVILV